MKICVPVEKNEGLKSAVYGHFGSAPAFAVYDTESGETEFLDNANDHHEHGQCNPVGAIKGKGINAVAVGGIGLRALQLLNSQGIKVYRASQPELGKLIEDIKNDSLKEMTAENSCREHGCR
ncbi:MAG: diguanylate cyclase [Elusimicrobia bacterium CG08_land_8_20_14_0_20_51_18]|nr:MAG: diguanylate cyclase [Elusimicrobia bacterium CG08_land_8_20_14_0_20_51_18]